MGNILFLGTLEDKPYTHKLKPLMGGVTTYVITEQISTVTEVIMYCKNTTRNITGIVTTSVTLLTKLLEARGKVFTRKFPSLNDYAGSLFEKDGIEIVFINPLAQLISISYGEFIARRYISKLISPDSWMEEPQFNWVILDPSNIEEVFNKYKDAYAIACDIETFKENLAIRCIGYTAIFISNGIISTHSCVLPVDSEYNLAWMRRFNWELQAPKIFQNGKYDISYLSRYNAVPFKYIWDTAHLFHSWYSELPKDLAFINSFFIRKSMYWKDLATTEDLYEYYKYNALDTQATALSWIQCILQMPEWAENNYLQEFPLVFPCHLSEMTGIKRDFKRMEEQRIQIKVRIESKLKSLEILTATPGINTNSPVQIKKLLTVLGCSDIKTTEEKDLKKAILRHPINSRILNLILDIRGDRKLISTYLRTDEDITKTSPRGKKELGDRILYALNPHGTDTGRLASKEHHFWTGLQIQNIPRDNTVKSTLIADDGFLFAECDLEQAESRDTAYISGDKNLIHAVDCGRDFHSLNASAFFGIPYEQIYDDILKKVLDKVIRDLAKRVNHGANYLMGVDVLIDTMGEDKIWEAKRLLRLDRFMGLRQVAEYLLEQFHKTYSGLRGILYPGIIAEVATTRMLRSKAIHSTEYQAAVEGWTRYCFGNPSKNKRDLNAYVAHVPQSLNAMTLNKSYMKVFYEIAIDKRHSENFKLCAQIHDSILFQFREGHEYLCDMVRERMEIPITIKAYDCITRTFKVPAAVKAGVEGLGVKYWSECE